MVEPANKAENTGYGIIKIPEEQRTYAGVTLSGDTVNTVVTYKIANPLASHSLIADMLGIGYSTVASALSTPWAKGRLAHMGTRMEQYSKKLEETQGNSVHYWGRLVEAGSRQVDRDNPNPTLVNAGLKATELVGKATGLLSEQHLVKHEIRTAQDYRDDDLELDPSLATILDDPEGESPLPPDERIEGIIPDDTEKNNPEVSDP